MLGSVEGKAFHLHGILEADLILGTLPPAVMRCKQAQYFNQGSSMLWSRASFMNCRRSNSPQLMSMLRVWSNPTQSSNISMASSNSGASSMSSWTMLVNFVQNGLISGWSLGLTNWQKSSTTSRRSFILTAPISMISTFRGFRLRQQVASRSYTMNCLSLIGRKIRRPGSWFGT